MGVKNTVAETTFYSMILGLTFITIIVNSLLLLRLGKVFSNFYLKSKHTLVNYHFKLRNDKFEIYSYVTIFHLQLKIK